jgi:hypothetical protein
MNKSFILCLIFLTALGVSGQDPAPSDANPRVIVTSTLPTPAPVRSPAATAAERNIADSVRPISVTIPAAPSDRAAGNTNASKALSFAQIKNRLAEAKRQMQTRPLLTSLTEPMTMSVPVRIAYYDWTDEKVEYIVLSKEAFLTANSPVNVLSSNGRPMTTRTIRANGVNTPVVITDMTGQAHLPLMVQYPVERGGKYYETAYYMSTHPGIVTPEVVAAGKFYVHNTIEIARDKLKKKGFSIQPRIADIAERLATVEHVDHLRFRTEYHPNIYNDIFTLFALNEGQTYRYSVSSAGAGGMVQMIPSTYRIVRSRYPGAALMPDFVEGMRDHVNAAQAMLLYMQMTWDDLISRPTITNALLTGIATQEQLMSAGYNSNPAKLAGYINRGGTSWTSLIPRETQIYLRIYDSLERAVPMTPRKL